MRVLTSLFLLAVAFLLFAVPAKEAQAVFYTCPSGGSLSGTTCSYAATPNYYCPTGGTLSGSTCVNKMLSAGKSCDYAASPAVKVIGTTSIFCGDSYNFIMCPLTESFQFDVSCPSSTSTYANLKVWKCDTINGCYAWASTDTTTTAYGWGNYGGYHNVMYNGAGWLAVNSNTGYFPQSNGTSITGSGYVAPTYGNVAATVASYSCPSGGSPSGATCYYTATTNYTCNAGDTLSGTTCLNTSKIRTRYTCQNKTGQGIDPFILGTAGAVSPETTMCRPRLLTNTGQSTWYCPIEAGDPPTAIQNGAATTGWYLKSGITKVNTLTQTATLSAPSCFFQPPTVDGVYSFSTYECPSPDTVIGVMCRQPIQTLASSKSTGFSCSGADVMNGSTSCTPVLKVVSATATDSYSCLVSGVIDSTAVLNTITHQCVPPLQISTTAPIMTSAPGYQCGTNAKINTTVNPPVCSYIAMPAIAVNGTWKCDSSYTLSGTWCVPNASWTYPAAWNLGQYSCPNGGTIGMVNGVANGLCYM
ncbi:MAG: hypothetical protein WCH01_11655 [Methylococcaceae bacterium]